MNTAEFINATIGFALEGGRIDPTEAAKLRGRLLELVGYNDQHDYLNEDVRNMSDEVRRRFDNREPTQRYMEPKFIVVCLGDDSNMVVSTHRIFDTSEEAFNYANTIAISRSPRVVEMLRPLYTAEQEFGEDQ